MAKIPNSIFSLMCDIKYSCFSSFSVSITILYIKISMLSETPIETTF